MNSADISIENYGSIILFRMNTTAAFAWVIENVQQEAQFFGDALAVEHRYAQNLVVGMRADGLVLS
jgi:hypothetical protein